MKKRRVYQPRVGGGRLMLQADLERLHKYMLEIEDVDAISDEMRAVVESEWPELAYKLPPKKAHPGLGRPVHRLEIHGAGWFAVAKLEDVLSQPRAGDRGHRSLCGSDSDL